MGEAVTKHAADGAGRHTVSIGTGSDTEPEADLTEPGRAGRGWKAGLVGLAVAFVVLAAYDLSSVAGRTSTGATAPHAAASPRPAATATAPPPSAAALPTQAQQPAALPLSVTSVTAFGPDGPSDGDHPGTAGQVGPVRPAEAGGGAGTGTAQPWSTSWYASPRFGNLQSGTGLLLDMGHPVTVSSVVLALGPARGADVQVRVGNGHTLAGLPVTASAAQVGGDVRVPVSVQTAGRYVLIWFTRLPPDGQGHYQVDVYGVTVNGASAAS
jgi:hypothetical protein